MTDEELIEMARLAQRDDRMSTGALYGDLADRIQAQAAEIAAYRIQAQAAEIERLRLLVPRPDQTQDELVWRDHMRGVPLAALAKEFGITKERMRYRLKRIAENKLHLTGAKP